MQNTSEGIFILSPRRDFGALGVPRGSKNIVFFKHGHVACQIDGDDQQNRMQNFHPRVKLVTLG